MGARTSPLIPVRHRGSQDLVLHDYQQLAVEFLRDRNRAALFLDMGLGKTAICLSALEPRHLPALVVAPKRVAESVWPHERDIWRPDLTLALAAGRPEKRAHAIEAGADITVISRDNLSDVVKSGRTYKTFIFDELSGAKTPSTRRFKAARKVSEAAENFWGLTGTPEPNGLLDLWSQVFLIDLGERLGRTFSGYRERYFVPGRQLATGVITEWIPRPGVDQVIHEKLGDVCLSMSSLGRVELPPVTVNTVEVPFDHLSAKVYKGLKRDLVFDLELIGGRQHYAPSAAQLSSKLCQLSAGFLYHENTGEERQGYDIVHSNKIAAVEEIVEGTGSPVLVFYRFRAELEMLKKALGKRAHTIDEPGVIERWNRGKVPVLLAHPASAGHGLNLQYGGHTIVWTSLPWSLEEKQQADKRLARQGQKNPVVIHEIITPNSIDPRIQAVLQKKDNAQSELLDYLESPL